MAFVKGVSGNIAGRPKGIPDRRTVYRESLQKRAPDIINALIEKALDGDTTAMRICVDRILPTLKASDAPVNIQLDGDMSKQGQQVLDALGNGTLSPSEAGAVFSALQAQARLIESDELIERVEKLEAASGSKHQ